MSDAGAKTARPRQPLPDAPDDAPSGRPYVSHPRLAPSSVDRYLAAAGGPLAYMVRLRTIERQLAVHAEQLRDAWLVVTERCAGEPERFARAWHAVAASWDFGETNALIEKHNRYYPAEARLPMDPRTGDFAHVNGRPYIREPLGADWVLTQFPARLPA